MAETTVQRQRRQAVYALVGFCAAFFVGAIVLSYCVAAAHGYGTGFGDGRVAPVEPKRGHGFLADGAILGGAIAIDAFVVFAWYWLISRLDAPAPDDPLPTDDGADLSVDENWYFIQIPRLTAVLTGIAVFCTAGVAILASANLPIVLLRFGW